MEEYTMDRNCREVIFSALGIEAYFKKKATHIRLFRLLTPCLDIEELSWFSVVLSSQHLTLVLQGCRGSKYLLKSGFLFWCLNVILADWFWPHITTKFLIEMKSEVPRPNAGLIGIDHFQSFTAATDHLWKFLGTVWKQSLLIQWKIMGSEEWTAEQSNSQQRTWLMQLHQPKLRTLMMPFCWLCGSPTSQTFQPVLQGCGVMVLLCASLIFLLCCCPLWHSKSGRRHREAYLSHAPPSLSGTQEHAREKAAQSRKMESQAGCSLG